MLRASRTTNETWPPCGGVTSGSASPSWSSTNVPMSGTPGKTSMLAAGSPMNATSHAAGGGAESGVEGPSAPGHPTVIDADPTTAHARTRAPGPKPGDRPAATSRRAWGEAQEAPAGTRGARPGTTTFPQPPARPGGLWTTECANGSAAARRSSATNPASKKVPAADNADPEKERPPDLP